MLPHQFPPETSRWELEHPVASLFVSFRQKDNVAIQPDLIPRETHDRFSKHCHASFEMQGPASVNIAVLDCSGKRIDTPLLAFDTNYVRVGGN
jgi:hypothetical protein